MTALMMASKKGHLDCVETLLQGGADVTLQDNVSSTSQGNEMSVASLCDQGER